jgi:hypothetical protein
MGLVIFMSIIAAMACAEVDDAYRVDTDADIDGGADSVDGGTR